MPPKHSFLICAATCFISLSLAGNFSSIKLIELKNINTKTMQKIRHRRACSVFYAPTEQVFYKIYPEKMINEAALRSALECGFYTGMCPLKALIFSQGKLVGHVIAKGIPAKCDSSVALKHVSTEITFAQPKNNSKYGTLIAELLERTKKYHYVYVDLTPDNVVIVGKKCQLIDIESIITLEQFAARPDYLKYFMKQAAYPAHYKRALLQIVYQTMYKKNTLLTRNLYHSLNRRIINPERYRKRPTTQQT